MKDVIVTVVAAIVLALLFMFLLLTVAFSGWGDPPPASPQPSTSGAVTVPVPEATSSRPSPTTATPTIDPNPPTIDAPYALDCGPLEGVRCQGLADRLVKANEAHSGKRVVSIVFTTECGSYTLLLEGGSGVGADVDCIPLPRPSG